MKDAINPLDLEYLRDFDHAKFGVLARSLQILLGRGLVEPACSVVRQFAQQARKTRATLSTYLVDVVPVKVANMLEEFEVTTVEGFVRLTDSQLARIPNCGEGVIRLRDRLKVELATGELVEGCDDEEGLYFDFTPEDCVPSGLVKLVEGIPMHSGVSERPMSVMEALKVLAEHGEAAAREIDAKIDDHRQEIVKLKKMRGMLGKSAPRKLSASSKGIAELVAKFLRDNKGSFKPAHIANKVTSPSMLVTAIIVGKIAKNDSRFMRYSDGTVGLA